MELIISNVDKFKTFFEVVYNSASDLIELQFFPNRMTCSLLSRGRDRFYNIEYDMKFFDLYDVEEVSSVTVFLDDLYNLLKYMVNRTDILTLSFNESYMVAKIESKTGNTRLLEYVLPTEFVDSPKAPTIDLDAVFTVDVTDIKQSVKDIQLAKTMEYRLSVNEGGVDVSTDRYASIRYNQHIDADVEFQYDSVSEASSRFAVNYIEEMAEFSKINKNVEIKMGTDTVMCYKFEDSENGIVLNGLIANLVEEN